jgi:hypothetical protein
MMMAIMMGIALYFFAQGLAGDQTSFQIGFIIQLFMMIMLLIWAATNFCPSTWMLKKAFPDCEWDDK